MPQYYSVRETDSYADVTLHEDRNCPDGPVRAAPSTVDGEVCPECGESKATDLNVPDLTVSELRDAVADIDDVGRLESIRGVEAKHKDRVTALEAIDDRLAEL